MLCLGFCRYHFIRHHLSLHIQGGKSGIDECGLWPRILRTVKEMVERESHIRECETVCHSIWQDSRCDRVGWVGDVIVENSQGSLSLRDSILV